MSAPVSDLLEQAKQRRWYHALELAPGFATEGLFDLRPYVGEYGLPERMDGLRALEVGCWDGFWSFEMERRGAEVVAIDLDDERDLDWPARRRPQQFPDAPRGEGFRLAKEILGSKVERINCSVYHATPEELGTFDIVFCGSVLVHLRDQLLALERIASLCTRTFISAEGYDRLTDLIPFPAARFHADREAAVVYWMPARKTWKRMMLAAGFDRVQERSKFNMESTAGYSVRHVVHHAHKS
jgi:tRNA (mo5U34)-methyltransferase